MGAMAMSHVAMLITLLVMRYRQAGRVCSGDFNDSFNFYSLMEEPIEPYLHMTGSFYFYLAASHAYIAIGVFAGYSFQDGVKRG